MNIHWIGAALQRLASDSGWSPAEMHCCETEDVGKGGMLTMLTVLLVIQEPCSYPTCTPDGQPMAGMGASPSQPGSVTHHRRLAAERCVELLLYLFRAYVRNKPRSITLRWHVPLSLSVPLCPSLSLLTHVPPNHTPLSSIADL